MDKEQLISQMHAMANQYQNTTLHIINELDSIANKLNTLEEYEDIETINSIALKCYRMLKLSFCVSEFNSLINHNVFLNMNRYCLNDYLSSTLVGIKLMLSSTEYNLVEIPTDDKIHLDFDERYLNRALFLLISAACENSAKGSTVTVSYKRLANNAVISISDESDGIVAEDLGDLFCAEPGEEFNFFGTTVSLRLAKLIIEQLGGSMMVTSKQNVGTTVTLTLPITDEGMGFVEFKSSVRPYLTNRYSDMHVIFCNICKFTFF